MDSGDEDTVKRSVWLEPEQGFEEEGKAGLVSGIPQCADFSTRCQDNSLLEIEP